MIEIRVYQNGKIISSIGFDKKRVIVQTDRGSLSLLSVVDSHTFKMWRADKTVNLDAVSREILITEDYDFKTLRFYVDPSDETIIREWQ